MAATRSIAAGALLSLLAACEQSGPSTQSTPTESSAPAGGSAPAGAPAPPAPDAATGAAPGQKSITAPSDQTNPGGSTFTLRPGSLAGRDSLAGIAEAVKAFEVNMDRFPSTGEGLEVLIAPDRLESGRDRWQGPYVQSADMLRDTYRNTVEYESTGDGFVLRSLGADGARGGSGSSADIELRYP